MKSARKHRSPRRFGLALLGVLLISAMSPMAALAASDCKCLANGRKVDLGSVVCLQISPSQSYLARCERVLNNTSWKKLEDGCPSASRSPQTKKATGA